MHPKKWPGISVGQISWSRTLIIVRKTEKRKNQNCENMGVNGKIVLSLLLVATLAHGQWSVDLNGGDKAK